MSHILSALLLAFLLLAVTGAPAHANDDYLVPITVGSRTFTLTVSVGTTGVSVRVGDPAVTLGTVTKATRAVAAAATPTATTPTATPALATLDDQKAQAVTIPYDELFRYNEQHVGKVVRYVGQVVQVQENACMPLRHAQLHPARGGDPGQLRLLGRPDLGGLRGQGPLPGR
jgi:hypothetical protein